MRAFHSTQATPRSHASSGGSSRSRNRSRSRPAAQPGEGQVAGGIPDARLSEVDERRQSTVAVEQHVARRDIAMTPYRRPGPHGGHGGVPEFPTSLAALPELRKPSLRSQRASSQISARASRALCVRVGIGLTKARSTAFARTRAVSSTGISDSVTARSAGRSAAAGTAPATGAAVRAASMSAQ